jgi:hypothetical protein
LQRRHQLQPATRARNWSIISPTVSGRNNRPPERAPRERDFQRRNKGKPGLCQRTTISAVNKSQKRSSAVSEAAA